MLKCLYKKEPLFGVKRCSFCDKQTRAELLYKYRICQKCKTFLEQGRKFDFKNKKWTGGKYKMVDKYLTIKFKGI